MGPFATLWVLFAVPRIPDDADVRRYLRSVVVSATASTIVYLAVLDGFLRAMPFSNFYDLQARAILDGRLDVPQGSLGIEAFVHDGRHFLYFPPGPALLRLPLLALTDQFDGRLTAVSLLLAWFLTIGLTAALLWRVRRMLRPSTPLDRIEARAYGFLLLACTGGAVVLFLGAIPWVYHEAYAWAIVMALGFGFSLLGVVERPTNLRIFATGAFTAGAILSRTTAGWACAAAIVLAAMVLPASSRRHARDLWWRLWLAAAVPVAIGMAVNWAKFRHPFLFPIRDQVFTALNSHRRAAIEANGGDLISPDMISTTLANYFRPNGIRFVSVYPYITLPPHIARSYGDSFVDQANRTGSVTAFAPLLLLLTAAAIVMTLRPGADPRLRPLRTPLLGLGAIPLGILFYAYLAHRYTSEFLPLLVLGGAIGFAELYRRLEGRSRRTRRAVTRVLAALAIFSTCASTAAALNTNALAFPTESTIRQYIGRQMDLSQLTGRPLDDYVAVSAQMPADGPADRIQIVGSCDAYYLASGDEFHPWAEVATRSVTFTVTPDASTPLPVGSAVIARFMGHRTLRLELTSVPGGSFRLQLVGGGPLSLSPLEEFSARGPFRITIAGAGRYHFRATVEGLPRGAPSLTVDRESYDVDWVFRPNVLTPSSPEELSRASIGAQLKREETPPLEQCEELLREDRR